MKTAVPVCDFVTVTGSAETGLVLLQCTVHWESSMWLPQGGALTCKIENLQFTQCNAISYTQYQPLMKQLTIIRLTGKQHHSVTVGHVP